MPNHSHSTDPKDMAGDVDRLLRQLDPAAIRHPRPRPGPRPTSSVAPARNVDPSPLSVWVRVVLGAVLLVALTQWPYRYCGSALGAYLFGVGMVPVAGLWAAHGTWHLRMGGAHVVALLVILAGAALGAHEVLVRVGYAAAHAAWGCPG